MFSELLKTLLSGQSRYQMFSYKFLALFGSQLLSAILAHQTRGVKTLLNLRKNSGFQEGYFFLLWVFFREKILF